ncbi:hypothetical protein AAFF_G00200530 [Aldrovandia affinis]|uniref:Uncharacterized protein n=1 Tax=Aldrovandia affinis TaxID=143900 RepID=A0AAD7RI14_9TELE|nr:hypothetical protein AAFF_G00200530 [Aldrovandia affinis]
MQELMVAVQQMVIGHSPGIDGVCRLAHLRQAGGCGLVTPQELVELLGVHSLRVLERVLGNVQWTLPGRELEERTSHLEGVSPFPSGESDYGSR